jgi:hypothetical protein
MFGMLIDGCHLSGETLIDGCHLSDSIGRAASSIMVSSSGIFTSDAGMYARDGDTLSDSFGVSGRYLGNNVVGEQTVAKRLGQGLASQSLLSGGTLIHS